MENNPVLTGPVRRQLITLAVPLLASDILQQLYNTVDSIIIGSFLGTEAFAASGIAGSVMNLFIFILNGFCIGVGVLFSNAYGAGDLPRFRQSHFTAFLFGSLFTLALSSLCMLLLGPLLRLISTPDELMGYCRSYLYVILAGLLMTWFYNLFSAILRSVGSTGASLFFLGVSVVTNVILDLLFVGVFSMGIRGAAIATVAAQGFSALCCFIYLLRRCRELIFTREDFGFHPALLKRIFSYGTTSALHQSSLYIGKLMIQGLVNTCGTSAIAAFTAATRIEAFINAPGNGASQAESIFLAQNLAAGNDDRVRKGLKESFFLIEAAALVLAALMYAVSPSAIRLFLDSGETEALASGIAYLRLVLCFYVFSYFGYAFVGAARGYGKMIVPFIATTGHLTIRVVVSWLLIGHLGLTAVAWATGIGWVGCVLYHFFMFRRYTAQTRA